MEKEILENPVVKNGLAILSNINDELKYNNILNINNLLLKMSVILGENFDVSKEKLSDVIISETNKILVNYSPTYNYVFSDNSSYEIFLFINEYMKKILSYYDSLMTTGKEKFDRYVEITNGNKPKDKIIKSEDLYMKLEDIQNTMSLLNEAVRNYYEIYHNKTLIATFTDEQIINFKIKESELAHLLGVNMKKIVMNEKYVDLFNITPKEIEYIMDNTYTLDPNGSATIDVLHRIVDISNGNLLQFEEDRLRKIDNYQYQTIENNKDSLLNEYSKWNMRSKAFIDFKPLEELSLVLNFPEGYKIIKQLKDENPQHSLLISKNKLSEQFKYSTLVANYNKKQDRRYFQSLFLRKPNEFEQLQQDSIPAITTRVELSSDDGSGSVLRNFSRLEQAQFLKEIQNDFEKLDLGEVANYFHDMVYKHSLSIRKGF